MNRKRRRSWEIARLFPLALLLATAATVAGGHVTDAEAYTLKVKVEATNVKYTRNVQVTVSGGDLVAPLVKYTNDNGVAKFANLNAGTYTVVPTKEGLRYEPEVRTVTLSADKTVKFTAKKLLTVATVTVSKHTVDLLGDRSDYVVVSVRDAQGKGVARAPVTITNESPDYVTVTPAEDKADMSGQLVCSLKGSWWVGTSVVTFSSGGWKGTAVLSDTTTVNVILTLPEGDLWAQGKHAQADAAAFTHWDSEGIIPVECAECHSRWGFLDFLGADGTAPGVVDNPAPTGTVVDCYACHNDQAASLTSVRFPSGATIENLGNEAICMTCHQGRASGSDVDAAVAGLPEDTPDSSLGLISIHYTPGAATRYGTLVKGGYQYAGKAYEGMAPHAPNRQLCLDCHNNHRGLPDHTVCMQCHLNVTIPADLPYIRMAGSWQDYNGNGSDSEGIYFEVDAFSYFLYVTIQEYAADVAGTWIAYDRYTYPYWFIDSNQNGAVDEGENVYGNRYNAWTPRLLKAAYNHDYYIKDKGNYAHGAKYMIELLYDSLENLSAGIPGGGWDMTNLKRNDIGHFDTTSLALRFWDASGTVPATCARCHSAEAGLAAYLQTYGPVPAQPPAYRTACATCHTAYTAGAPRKYAAFAIFPSGATFSNSTALPKDSYLCIACHQGQESKSTVDSYLAANGYTDADAVYAGIFFRNIHYLPAGATMYGADAAGGYEYDGNTYQGKWGHNGGASNECDFCHTITLAAHSFLPAVTDTCTICHNEAAVGDVTTLRKERTADYDGDGSTSEPLAGEVADIAADLYDQVKVYALAHGGGIVYDGATYPYWFQDFDSDGVPDEDVSGNPIAYAVWTPRLLKAGYNYQVFQKEPGAWAHNTFYILQLLIDSVADLGGNVSGYVRP